MNRRIAAAAAGAVATSALVATASAQAAPPATDAPATLALTAVQTQVHPQDVKPKGPSVGDRTTFSEDLFASSPTGRRGARMGTDGGECVVTNLAKAKHGGAVSAVTTQCTATLALKDGQITVQGLATSGAKAAQQSTLAITGGTGGYTGARGTMTITGSATETTSALALTYTLPPAAPAPATVPPATKP